MATGDSNDMQSRLVSLIPSGWINGVATYAPAIIGAIGDQLSIAYSLLQYAISQTRITTATGVFLDLISLDYFGFNLLRRTSEADASFRARIQKELFRTRVTRPGVVQALIDLTGRTPVIFEPTRPADTGAYGTSGRMGYGSSGGYGSMRMPSQCLINAYRPLTAGVPKVGGYHSGLAYRTASASEYASISTSGAFVADAAIDAQIVATKAAGVVAWVRINS